MAFFNIYATIISVMVGIVSGISVCPSEEVLNERMEATVTVRESVIEVFSSVLNVSSSAARNNSLTSMEVYEQIATSVNATVTQSGLVRFEEAISEIAASTYAACSASEESRVQANDTSALIEMFFTFTNSGNISLAREVYGKLLCLQNLLETESQTRRKRQNHQAELDAFFDMLEGHPDIIAPIFGLTEDQFFGILPTLAFVVDDTGSMAGEIGSAMRLIISFISVERSKPIAYILTTFNDPEVGVPAKYFSNNITQLRELEQAVNALNAHDGGDCPELGMTGILNALDLVNPDSNIIVLTDASPKDLEKKQQVIDKANEVKNSVHFFLARDGCGNFTPYMEVANATEGIVVNEISDFEAFARFAEEAGRFTLDDSGSRRKRQISENCAAFSLSIFSYSVTLLFTSSSINITITSPSGVINTVPSTGTIATYNLDTPEAGEYRICSTIEFDYSVTAPIYLDFFVEYTDINGSSVTTVPPAGNTIGVLVTSSRINDISNGADLFLNLVLTDRRVFSNVLTHCGSLLTGIITIPNVSFQFQLEGSDSEGNRFKTNVDIQDVSLIVAPFNVTIHGSTQYIYGDTLELNCTSEGSPTLQYSWSRKTSSDNMFPAGATINNNTIIIHNLSVSDGGHYTCTVSNEAGNFSATTTVNVGGAPYNVTIDGVTQYFTGDTLQLNCFSHGNPELQYSWNRNTSSGQNIFSTNVTSGNLITISNVTIDDEGVYSCTVTNEGGSSSYDILITIIDIPATVHNEYYLGYFNNFGGTPSIILINSEPYPISYSIEAPVLGYASGQVTSESTLVINLPTSVVVTSGSDQNKGVYLKVGSNKMTVMGQDIRSQTTSTFLALPNVQLAIKEYVYYGMTISDATTRTSVILIVGTENSTMMNLTTTQPVIVNVSNNTINFVAGREYSFRLDRFQTVYIATFTDLTGTKIITDKPVSVFSGHECVYIPSTTAGCDHIVEQIPPTAVWGKVFYISPLLTRKSYTIKILAAYNNTNISLHCNDTFQFINIGEGEAIVRTFMLQKYCAIHSTKSILVAQFSHGQFDDDADAGDPMMMLIPAKIHYTSKFSLSTIRNPATLGYQHFFNVIVLARDYHPHMIYIKVGSVRQSLDVFTWVPIKVNNITESYVLRLNISEGVAELVHADPTASMAAMVYGFGWYEGYGHAFDLGVPKNYIGNTSTTMMNFSTDQTAPSVAPSNFQAINITSASITFHWDALVDQANGIIQFYVITCSSNNNITIMVNVNSGNTSQTIGGLIPFTNYTCELYAATVLNGPTTDPVTVRTAEQVPTPPEIRQLIVVDSKSVFVEWKRPEKVYGILIFYTIIYVTGSGMRTSTVHSNGSEAQSYVITELSPYQLITVTITATNGAGTSEPSNEVSGRTHQAAPGVVKITDVFSISSSTSCVKWNPPIEPNGIITGYEIIYSVHGEIYESVIGPLESNKHASNITNLVPGTPYTVIVVAFTSAGRGEENHPYTFFSHELPPQFAPRNIKYERNGTTIKVTWESVSLFEARGFPIYTITLTPKFKRGKRQSTSDGVIIVTTNETNVTIEGLDPNVEYSLTVAVGTTSGNSIAQAMNIPVVNEKPDESSNDVNDDNSSVVLITVLVCILCFVTITVTVIIIILYKIKKRKNELKDNVHHAPGQDARPLIIPNARRSMEVVNTMYANVDLQDRMDTAAYVNYSPRGNHIYDNPDAEEPHTYSTIDDVQQGH